MNPSSDVDLTRTLAGLVASSDPTMRALRAVRCLGLASWCIGAGAIRNLVWDHLHGFTTPTMAEDVDMVFYDASDLSVDLERRLETRLRQIQPEFNWEVVNQAAVHRWLRPAFGQAAKPFQSLAEGIASWPEVATCVGTTLTDSGTVEIIAPHGLTDLFDMIVRWNPARASRETFMNRVASKRFSERWPRVQVLALKF